MKEQKQKKEVKKQAVLSSKEKKLAKKTAKIEKSKNQN